MARKRVDTTKRETPAERRLAEGIADNGPPVESVADRGRMNDQFGSMPYDPSKSIDRDFTLNGS